MPNGVLTAALTAAMTVSGLSARAADMPRPPIGIVVYDSTSIPIAMLQRAKDEVARIFRDADIDVVWIDAAPEQPPAMFVAQIVIRRQAAPGSASASAAAMGTSLGDSHDVSGTAMLFRDRITHVARGAGLDVAGLLAFAMVHEIGHLLLPHPAHASTGMMRAGWDGDDLRHIADRSLAFSQTELALIRAKAAGCSSAQRLRPAVLEDPVHTVTLSTQRDAGEAYNRRLVR